MLFTGKQLFKYRIQIVGFTDEKAQLFFLFSTFLFSVFFLALRRFTGLLFRFARVLFLLVIFFLVLFFQSGFFLFFIFFCHLILLCKWITYLFLSSSMTMNLTDSNMLQASIIMMLINRTKVMERGVLLFQLSNLGLGNVA